MSLDLNDAFIVLGCFRLFWGCLRYILECVLGLFGYILECGLDLNDAFIVFGCFWYILECTLDLNDAFIVLGLF